MTPKRLSFHQAPLQVVIPSSTPSRYYISIPCSSVFRSLLQSLKSASSTSQQLLYLQPLRAEFIPQPPYHQRRISAVPPTPSAYYLFNSSSQAFTLPSIPSSSCNSFSQPKRLPFPSGNPSFNPSCCCPSSKPHPKAVVLS